jgi:hypothetical protein
MHGRLVELLEKVHDVAVSPVAFPDRGDAQQAQGEPAREGALAFRCPSPSNTHEPLGVFEIELGSVDDYGGSDFGSVSLPESVQLFPRLELTVDPIEIVLGDRTLD